MTNPRPINCSSDEARRILDGTTTQLRRYDDHWFNQAAPGDLFWLREPHRFMDTHNSLAPSTIEAICPAGPCIHFEADGRHEEPFGKVRPARTLLRTLSRACLKITEVRMDHLQRWNAFDQIALGLAKGFDEQSFHDFRIQYACDWDVNRQKVGNFGKRKVAAFWSDNPMVRVINFTLIQSNIDQLLLTEAV